MIRGILYAMVCVTVVSPSVVAQDTTKREFSAITVESDSICRAWFLPTDAARCNDRLKSRRIPVAYIEEIGLIKLTGRMNYRVGITFEELLKSTELDGLDLSYIDLREDELTQVSKCQSLRYLYLSGVKLTDPMVDSLGKMGYLECLNVYETGLTAQQAERLNAMLPKVTIEAEKLSTLAAACDGYLHLDLTE